MFHLDKFIKKGLISAIGEMADYQVILNAGGWYEKGVLTEDDLEEIDALIEAKNVTAEDAVAEYDELIEQTEQEGNPHASNNI